MVGHPASTGPLQTLLSVARVARTHTEDEALPAIAALLADAVGFKTVVINLHRPAWDDFQVVVVHGSESARAQLLGRTEPRDDWSSLLDDAYLYHGTYFHRRELHPPSGYKIGVHVPDLPPSTDPGRWHPEDLLLLALRDSAGELLGVLSVDEPISGHRPTGADLDLLAMAAAHVADSLEQREVATRSRRFENAIHELLRVSATLSGSRSLDEVLTAVCEGISSALGFEQVVALLADSDGIVRPRAAAGSSDLSELRIEPFALSALDPLVDQDHLRHGCALLDRFTAHRLGPPQLARGRMSRRNGIGSRAWRGHHLHVPLRDPDGMLIGAIWVDEPTDRLLPSDNRLRALRLFADQAASAVEVVLRLTRLQVLAERDALTGLANRRALRAFLERRFDSGLAMLACDLDFFKAINDRLGHQVGDEILVRFAQILDAAARPSDLAVRLGGEEFALIIPGADGGSALDVAERIRSRVRVAFGDIPEGVSVSIGVAAASGTGTSVHDLLGEADRALYAAKRAGRNRSLLAPAHAPRAA